MRGNLLAFTSLGSRNIAVLERPGSVDLRGHLASTDNVRMYPMSHGQVQFAMTTLTKPAVPTPRFPRGFCDRSLTPCCDASEYAVSAIDHIQPGLCNVADSQCVRCNLGRCLAARLPLVIRIASVASIHLSAPKLFRFPSQTQQCSTRVSVRCADASFHVTI